MRKHHPPHELQSGCPNIVVQYAALSRTSREAHTSKNTAAELPTAVPTVHRHAQGRETGEAKEGSRAYRERWQACAWERSGTRDVDESATAGRLDRTAYHHQPNQRPLDQEPPPEIAARS